MPKYDTTNFDPPAPVAHVTVRHPATGASLSNVPMLIDTGADVTLLPRDAVEQLGVAPLEDKLYGVEGFDGGAKLAEVVQVELVFLGKSFKGQFLLIDQTVGILGRNIRLFAWNLMDQSKPGTKNQNRLQEKTLQCWRVFS